MVSKHSECLNRLGNLSATRAALLVGVASLAPSLCVCEPIDKGAHDVPLEMRLLSWNLLNFTSRPRVQAIPGIGTAREYEEILYIRDLAISPEPDVLVLQEVSDVADLDLFRPAFAASIEQRFYTDQRLDYDRFTALGVTPGLLNWLREFHTIPAGLCTYFGGDLVHCDRDFAGVQLDFFGVEMSIYSVHMRSSCSRIDPFGGKTDACRSMVHQYRQLVKTIAEDPGRIYVFVGDFNRLAGNGNERMYEWMKTALGPIGDLNLVAAPEPCRIGGKLRVNPIDYAILFQPVGIRVTARAETVSFRESSYGDLRMRADHCPIIFDFTWRSVETSP